MSKFNDKFEKYRETLGADKVNKFLATLGLGPEYVPKEPKLEKCPNCGELIASYKEIHPDTDMNEVVLICKVCGEV